MVLSKKSWHYWVYRQFFWGAPNNLCPYFWKVVISFIFFPIAFILALPWGLIKCMIHDPFEDENEKRLGRMAGVGFFTWFALLLIFCMVSMFFWKKESVIAIGMVGWTISGIILFIILGGFLVEKKPLKNTLITQFVKAKKGKYCPKIDWVDEPKRFAFGEDNQDENN